MTKLWNTVFTTADMDASNVTLTHATDLAQQRIVDFFANTTAEQLFNLFNGGAASASDAWLANADALIRAVQQGEFSLPLKLLSGSTLPTAMGAFTASGSTALRAARERPEAPVLGLTTSLQTARRLAVVWGVHAVVASEVHSMSETVAKASAMSVTDGFAVSGNQIVVIAGVPFGQSGTTNALRVAQVR